MWIPSEEGNTEAFALYGIQGWYARGFVGGFGLTGRIILTADAGGFGERSVHQVGGAVGYDFGNVQPVLQIRVPRDEELREDVPYVIGVGVTFRP